MNLNEAQAIVTGAARGLGRHFALALVREGAQVVAGDINAAGLRSLKGEAESLPGTLTVATVDIANEAAVGTFLDLAARELPGLNVLVNNAGVLRDGVLVTKEDDAVRKLPLLQWNKVLDINLTGQFLCAREAVRIFDRQGRDPGRSAAAGKIICMSSVHEVIPWAGHVNYAASKGGVMLMMKSLAQEVASRGIRVNGIAPGAIQTDINRAAWETPEALQRLLALIPYGRIGQPEDVARAAVWLASDASDYVTGTTLFVDGGMTLYPGFRENG